MAKNKKAKPFNPEVFLATADGGRTISKYEKEGVVFEQAQPADAVFYLISVTSEQGKEAVVGVIGKDDFFGEGCLNGQPLRLATATALTEMFDHARGKIRHDQGAPRRAVVCRKIHVPSAHSQQPH